MKVSLTAAERAQLRQWQKQRRDNDGYVKVTVVLMLDAGWPVGTVAETLGLDEATVYRYAQALADVGLARYLAHDLARAQGAARALGAREAAWQ